jgi:hypothetical protein
LCRLLLLLLLLRLLLAVLLAVLLPRTAYRAQYDGGYKHYDSYGSYGSGDYGHPVKGIKGGVLEFVAGFITTDGTVLYPDYNNTDLQPVEDYRELSSEGAVPLVTPGAAWFKVGQLRGAGPGRAVVGRPA